MIVRRAVAPLACLLAMSSALLAEPEGPDGTLRSIACGKLERPHHFDVVLEDDTPTNARIARTLGAELEKRRVELGPAAPLRLSLSIEAVHAPARHKRPDLGRFSHDTDRGTRVQLNLWSNEHDSLIGGRREGVTRQAIDELRLEIAINDKSNGRCVWQGEAVIDLDGRDAGRVAATVIPLLVAHIGETVRGEAITLD